MLRFPIGSRPVSALLLACGVMLSGNARGQESPEPAAAQPGGQHEAEAIQDAQPGHETRVFILEHASPSQLATVLKIFPARITASRPGGGDGPGALGVSASPAVLAAIAETIERLDQPPAPTASIELTAYILEATRASTPTEVPPVLEKVVAQLQQLFRYEGYRLVDSVVALTRENTQLQVQGASRDLEPGRSLEYLLQAHRARVVDTAEGEPRVRIDILQFETSMTVEKNVYHPGVSASVEIGDGQQVVVGKAGVGDSGNALILVLSARVSR